MKKLFGTDGIRGVANAYPMTPEIALRVGKAFAAALGREKPGRNRILIGKDTRLSCYMIEFALSSGLLSMGADVLLVGPMPTPACSHLTKSFAADAGIVISASHNPAPDNGIKFFDRDGYKLPDALEIEIEKLVLEGELSSEHVQGDRIGRARKIEDARGRYIEYAKGTIENLSLAGMRLVLDCANGATYGIAPEIFSELGADVRVYHDRPNGLNINEACGSEHPEFAIAQVLRDRADAGLILDGDGDRLILVDERGAVVDGDRILAMCALDLKARGELRGDTIVATEYSNKGLDIAMAEAGIDVRRVATGDRYVIEAMRAAGFVLGGEQSGHIIFLRLATTGDGLLSALQVLRLMQLRGHRLSELAECMSPLPQVLLNVDVAEKRPFADLPLATRAIEEARSALGARGRVYVRYSGTQAMCRIMVEGEDPDRIAQLAERIAEAIREECGTAGAAASAEEKQEETHPAPAGV